MSTITIITKGSVQISSCACPTLILFHILFSKPANRARRLFSKSAKAVNGLIYGHLTCSDSINSLS